MIKRIATLVAVMTAVSMVLATGPAKKKAHAYSAQNWTLNLGLGMPTGDLDDAGVDTMFMAGLDYGLGMTGNGSNSTSYIGALGMFGSGDSSLDVRTYGVHYGVVFGLGESNSNNPLKVKLQGGYYNSRLSNGSSDSNWGFGGLAGIVWMPSNGMGGGNFSIEGGFYFMPSVSSVDNRGYYISVGIPFGSK